MGFVSAQSQAAAARLPVRPPEPTDGRVAISSRFVSFYHMSVQEIKAELAGLSRQEQDEVVAYLFQLRHAHDSDYQTEIAGRLGDREQSHWLTPDEFERELNKKKDR